MGVWNVRIMHEYYPESEEHYLFPAEVHYADEQATMPTAYGTFHATGETLDEIRFYAKELLAACERPILESGETFPKHYVQ